VKPARNPADCPSANRYVLDAMIGAPGLEPGPRWLRVCRFVVELNGLAVNDLVSGSNEINAGERRVRTILPPWRRSADREFCDGSDNQFHRKRPLCRS